MGVEIKTEHNDDRTQAVVDADVDPVVEKETVTEVVKRTEKETKEDDNV